MKDRKKFLLGLSLGSFIGLVFASGSKHNKTREKLTHDAKDLSKLVSTMSYDKLFDGILERANNLSNDIHNISKNLTIEDVEEKIGKVNETFDSLIIEANKLELKSISLLLTDLKEYLIDYLNNLSMDISEKNKELDVKIKMDSYKIKKDLEARSKEKKKRKRKKKIITN